MKKRNNQQVQPQFQKFVFSEKNTCPHKLFQQNKNWHYKQTHNQLQATKSSI
jgi:phage protein U